MAKSNPNPSMRVLTRPQSSIPQTPKPQISQPQSSLHPNLTDKIVVVGFIGQNPHDLTQLINRILDSNVIGSGNLDKCILSLEKDKVMMMEEEDLNMMKNWFKFRQISYYWDRAKGILFLNFASALHRCLGMEDGDLASFGSGFGSVVEEVEFGDLQGLLFMFLVCHIIIYVQEGSRFDTQVLKKLRVLQTAKQGLAPFVRSKTPPNTSIPHSSPPSRPFVLRTSKNLPPARNSAMVNRNSSAISAMSGLGSFASLLPGQCTPVTLFVFLDDFSDVSNPVSNGEDSTDSSIFNQPSNLSSTTRSSLPGKGSGSVNVLARSVSKAEGGLKKKLQTSLEAQIRFLIKKCRMLSGNESSHTNSRSGRVPGSSPLFSLDTSRCVVLLDKSLNLGGKSLDFVSSIVEDILNGKVSSDALLLESLNESDSKEDVQLLKDFIYRQADILRGRGGLVNKANSSPAAGVGRVAAAAVAAAASAASIKTSSTPELPSLEIWLSSSQLLLHKILDAHYGCVDKTEVNLTKSRQQNTLPPQADAIDTKVVDHLELSLSCLESGKELNTKFSTLWCQRALPVAREIYLKELPPYYPTSQHEVHLRKALCAFRSMVKGPAVQKFAKHLEDECTSIWKSGRQLCDSVSLTGKPCMHQIHDIDDGLINGGELKSHCSGFVFLHACACGRTRRLQTDPFDFETANITFSCFPDCDKLLPSLQLPQVSSVGPIQASSWSLIRVGGSRYYDPSEGLFQSGFFGSHKFLLRGTIILENQDSPSISYADIAQQGSVTKPVTDLKADSSVDVSKNKDGANSSYQDGFHRGIRSKTILLENVKLAEKKVDFGSGISNFTFRKPFSQVVAGSEATDSEFPPLQLNRQLPVESEKVFKQRRGRDNVSEKPPATNEYQGSEKAGQPSTISKTSNALGVNDPFPRIGSNTMPVNMSSGRKFSSNTSPKQVIVYVGFEHECPRGHRFILTSDHLGDTNIYTDYIDHKMPNPSNFSRNRTHGKVNRHSNGNTTYANNMRSADKSKQNLVDGNRYVDRNVKFLSEEEQKQTYTGAPTPPNSVRSLEKSLQSVNVDDGGSAFSLINRDIPIYMNCPHCTNSKKQKDVPNLRYSSTVSQLQRIFVVTPPFPVVLSTCPIIQFEPSCLPPSILDGEQKLQFSLGCQVILPPESFLTLRLPFIYGVQLDDGTSQPLRPFEHQPELTAWISKGTALQVVSKGKSTPEE